MSAYGRKADDILEGAEGRQMTQLGRPDLAGHKPVMARVDAEDTNPRRIEWMVFQWDMGYEFISDF